MATSVEDNNIKSRYLDAIGKFSKEEVENANKAADFWYHKIGANVIPADTKRKEACILNSWKQYQSNPVPLEVFERWKELGLFTYGIGVVLGPLWRGNNAGKYLNQIDADNRLAIQEICSRNGKIISLEELAKWTLFEQHKDNLEKGHIYVLSTKPFPTKASDKGKPDTANKIATNEIPAIEVKNVGSLSFAWNSVHEGGYRYEFVKWIENPALCDEFPEHINNICKKYGLEYLDENGKGMGDIPIPELFKTDTVIYEGNNRHLQQLRVNDSLIRRNKGILPLDKIKQLALEWNQSHCKPPLDDKEFNELFEQSVDFISKNSGEKGKDGDDAAAVNNKHETFGGPQEDGDENKKLVEEAKVIVEKASEAIMNKHKLLTIEENKEIRYYRDGVYVPGGDILIEKVAEAIYGYGLANRHLYEIKGHVMRKTYHQRAEIDADINIINLKNGLYNMATGDFRAHSPECLSINQVPILYNPKTRPKLFGKFLQEVLHPSEIRTAIELIAYTFYSDNSFEIITILFGYGANGKSVFTGLLTALHGAKNVSNVPLFAMLDDRFALSDLEGKSVNIDTELTGTTIRDTSVLKKITGRQPIRIQRKNEKAYDTLIHAKLFFSANQVPVAYDESDAFFRRKVILGFPHRFEGSRDDPDLLKKLTSEEELSGIFNVLMPVLKRLLNRNRIYIKENSIEQRRKRYTIAASPIDAFLEEALAQDSTESDTVVKEVLYQAYRRFCNKHNLAILSKESLGKILKAGKKLEEGRESLGKRGTIWKGIKLTAEYSIDAKQETLDISTHASAVATTTTTTTSTSTTTANNSDNCESNISCYYCSYQTKIIKEYEAHVVLKHHKKPAFPGKADIESLGLSPKGNKWRQ